MNVPLTIIQDGSNGGERYGSIITDMAGKCFKGGCGNAPKCLLAAMALETSIEQAKEDLPTVMGKIEALAENSNTSTDTAGSPVCQSTGPSGTA